MPASVSIPSHSLGSSSLREPAVCECLCVKVILALTHSVHGDFRSEQLEERLQSVFSFALYFAVGAVPNIKPLARLRFQDMKLGQQTR
jgi:hypothetical protein